MTKIRAYYRGLWQYRKIGSRRLCRQLPDFEVAGVVRRASSVGNNPAELSNIPVVDDIKKLDKVDVAILCSPTRSVPNSQRNSGAGH